MLLNTKLNIFLKYIKIDMQNTFHKKEYKKELNIRLQKDKQFTNPNKKSNMFNNLFNNPYNMSNSQFNNQYSMSNNQYSMSNNNLLNMQNNQYSKQ